MRRSEAKVGRETQDASPPKGLHLLENSKPISLVSPADCSELDASPVKRLHGALETPPTSMAFAGQAKRLQPGPVSEGLMEE
jgi:hypothetical protein